MPAAIVWSLIFVASITVLIVASNAFIKAAEKIGVAFGIPTFIIGVTIVAAGTSLPELVSSIIAVASGSPEIVIGNVVGSNISNIFFILGFVAVFSRVIRIDYEIINVDLPLLIGSAFMLSIFVMDGHFSFFEAVLSIISLIVYLVYALNVETSIVNVNDEIKHLEEEHPKATAKTWLMLLLGGFFIYLSADYTVNSIIELSAIFEIGEEVIALTAVSLGTSLPELAVSIAAARKGNPDMAVGNILGSNIFNSFAVMGIPRLFGPLVIPAQVIDFSIPMMIAASLLYFFIAQNKLISRWEGFMLLIFYAYFIGQTFANELAF